MTVAAIDQISSELSACCRRLEGLTSGSALARNLSRMLDRLGQRLKRPPRIVLLGEFNTGKSTIVNALIGRDVLPTSIHANTRVPLLVHYSERPSLMLECRDHVRHRFDDAALALLRAGGGSMLHVGLPVAVLKSFELIDTPGLASGMMRPDDHVVSACRRAHIAIWCTSATQAWKASEQAVWLGLPHRLKRQGLLVATQADGLNTARDRERLEARLRMETAGRFAGLVLLAAAEADDVRRAPEQPDYAARWEACGGLALESQLNAMLAREMARREASARRVLARAVTRLDPAAASISHAA